MHRRICLSLLIFAAILGQTAIADNLPNVIVVMVDDMGYHELGVTGQLERAANALNHIDTPNIDTLATQGLLLTNFYATPICASSRSALLTGFHNGHSSVDRNGGNNGGNAMRGVDFTIGELFQSAGYATGQFGKWGQGGFDHVLAGVNVHNANTAVINFPDAIPTQQGFDDYLGYLNQVRAHDYYETFQWAQDGVGGVQVELTNESDYSHDLIADRALDFISNNVGQPFFLYLPFTIPHSNFNPPNDSIYQGYINAGYSNNQAEYAAMMKRMDNSIGDVIDRLQDPDQNGNPSDSVYDNTLILFFSDNGGTNENSLFDGGGMLRGQKGSVHEGGIATPLVAFWNGQIAPGQVITSRIASIDDLMATCACLIGVAQPVGIDGGSFSDLVDGKVVLDQRPYHVFEARNANDWAIRFDNWKLSKSGSNVLALYDLNSDPGETTDLKNSQVAIFNLLHQIALDEGVEADAGTGTAQTTNIVQYKTWDTNSGSTAFDLASNWLGGTEFNTRGSAVNNYTTGPAANWIATLLNTSGNDEISDITTNHQLLGMDISATSGTMSVIAASGSSLTVSNGLRIGDGGALTLSGGNLQTSRMIDIESGGIMIGSGWVRPQFDTTGTPFKLSTKIVNHGTVRPTGSGQTVVSVLSNGGFESGTGNQFSQTDDWFNFGGDESRNARNTSSPSSGVYRGIVGISSSSIPVSPAQGSGHLISLGDVIAISGDTAGASGWDINSDQINVSVYYLDALDSPVTLESNLITPTQNFGDGYDPFAIQINPVQDGEAEGRELFLRFESTGGNSEFASIDNIQVSVTTDGNPELTVDGGYYQQPNGKFELVIGGDVGSPQSVSMNVLDVIELDGSLTVEFEEDYVPTAGDSISIMQGQSVTGTFDSVEMPTLADCLQWEIEYRADAVILHFAENTIGPSGFEVIGQVRVRNGLEELCLSDDEKLGLTGPGLLGVADFELKVHSTSPTATPTSFRFNLESSFTISGGAVLQKIALKDYQTGLFELVDTRFLTPRFDSVTEIFGTGDPSRFVDQQTGQIEASIEYSRTTVTIFQLLGWTVEVDHAYWVVE